MKIFIVKIGGDLINNKKLLYLSLKLFCKLKGYKILVHGGGIQANYFLQKMGIKNRIVNGRRITDKKTLNMVVMVYAGLINKNIIAILQKKNCNAIGLSGADGNCITSDFRKNENIDYGYVGDIKSTKNINIDLIKILINNNIVPVFCSITHDKNGELLNTNADTIAANIAVSLSKKYQVELYFCLDKKGVLKNINDSKSHLKKINFELFKKMKKNNSVSNGMIPKLENAFFSLKNGVYKVIIGSPYSLTDIKGYNSTYLYYD